ncbi:hypothetical protein P1J78_20770 [Psychromarinibacter sp. C21-152]|uniref:Uncharacterized protein n=1 Tax=Psychromarinibacter sediminicola TaxID=3033385 RepID=A0AAE3NYS7_9RHOB|nr:hypothetical protein [Psychromarinibacter sediminicola]MDF0603182.1 hypothetical protein [Psychromarinibacter sediminicola]
MARLVLAVVFVAILLGGLALVALVLRRALSAADAGKGLGMAEESMLPKLAYALLIGLILYVSIWGGA